MFQSYGLNNNFSSSVVLVRCAGLNYDHGYIFCAPGKGTF